MASFLFPYECFCLLIFATFSELFNPLRFSDYSAADASC